ncbi:MAG: glycerol-3-phosphate dehydrogenase/oxidase [Acidobacteria bacterium]|nr:MAG: glycerol-3-phosphate dehydrogenase/oxidase [Acidobacteriota bacterium]
MKRDDSIQQIKERRDWDLLVIGGGASGLGVALEAVSRGYRTLLVEQHDFSKGTSSRSTKLIHGGVRYLRQGNFTLVRDALRERGYLLRNAPHLVHDLALVVPVYRWRDLGFYGSGLKLYDLLAGRLRLGWSQLLGRDEVIRRLPTIKVRGLKGGILYHDGQFDDARLAIDLAKSIAARSGVVTNYVQAVSLLKNGAKTAGAVVRDMLSGEKYEASARITINATGAFADHVRRLDDENAPPLVAASQGTHIVLDASFLPTRTALMVPKTEDGRVLFAIPWYNRVIVGTTDVAIKEASLEPVPLAEEVDFLLRHSALYLTRAPTTKDILSVFSGIRPLVSAKKGPTSALSRDHQVLISESGLVSLVGGKWTTYRKMGEDAVEAAMKTGRLEPRSGTDTRALRINGSALGQPALTDSLHPALPVSREQVITGVQEEMACTIEDVLARRTRALFLDARAALEMAPAVAKIMAEELGRDEAWQREQVESFRSLAKNYLPSSVAR